MEVLWLCPLECVGMISLAKQLDGVVHDLSCGLVSASFALKVGESSIGYLDIVETGMKICSPAPIWSVARMLGSSNNAFRDLIHPKIQMSS